MHTSVSTFLQPPSRSQYNTFLPVCVYRSSDARRLLFWLRACTSELPLTPSCRRRDVVGSYVIVSHVACLGVDVSVGIFHVQWLAGVCFSAVKYSINQAPSGELGFASSSKKNFFLFFFSFSLERERQRETERDRQTDRQTDRQSEINTHT